jgi:hypothetical protein
MGKEPQTVDQLLKELCDKPQAETAEARNERINGDKAVIEYLDDRGNWQPMEFVKEDGVWKLTIERPEPGEVEIESNPSGNSNKE